jgi:RNA polymerase sigma-70 factor (ECF subfamily)
MERLTDAEVMQRVREGDDEAFAVIVRRYQDSLVNYVTHLMRSRERAEEVAQDALVRLYRHATKYRDQERLGPYLFRIATNLVVTQVRRERRWALLVPRLRTTAHDTTPSPDANLLVDEIQRQVQAALERLPLKYRAPILLYDMEEWSYADIAQALGCRIGTVKSRIARGREQLRRELAPYWGSRTLGDRDERPRPEDAAARLAAHERVAAVRI